ncbi:hypothetical protein F5Y19DRAFT_98270 [Xylariaceae sp. FL1651]|nr:hypothetical protein F5Y19DRAFT_98270 [Xylariaceae sp. FL1651]
MYGEGLAEGGQSIAPNILFSSRNSSLPPPPCCSVSLSLLLPLLLLPLLLQPWLRPLILARTATLGPVSLTLLRGLAFPWAALATSASSLSSGTLSASGSAFLCSFSSFFPSDRMWAQVVCLSPSLLQRLSSEGGSTLLGRLNSYCNRWKRKLVAVVFEESKLVMHL